MKSIGKHISRVSRIFFAFSVTLFLAVSCPDPVPGNENIIETENLKHFKTMSGQGLYIGKDAILLYDELTCQKAWSDDGSLFRIQKDDQSAFLNVEHIGRDTGDTFIITYMLKAGFPVSITAQMRRVKFDDAHQWWWSDSADMGIIMP